MRVGALRPQPVPASSDYRVVHPGAPRRLPEESWRNASVVQQQHIAYQKLILEMEAGNPRLDLLTAAKAVALTALAKPTILEVGCGSGYYSQVLARLVASQVKYSGLDYSGEMIRRASQAYPRERFVVGDGAALPFGDSSFDIVMNGVSLMHMTQYTRALAESRRVASRWCIFHTVPLLQARATTILTKKAYGELTVEIIFNESELLALFKAEGMSVRHVLPSIPYQLEAILGELTVTKTFVCELQ